MRRTPGIVAGTQDEGLSPRNVAGIQIPPRRAAALTSIASGVIGFGPLS